MVNVKESESSLGFASDVFFQRTGKLRERVIDCSREELLDLAFFYIDLLDKTQGACERLSEGLQESLGWTKGPGLE